MKVVYDTLKRLGIEDKPVITALNKQDLKRDEEPIKDLQSDVTVGISAKNGEGTDRLIEIIEQKLREQKKLFEGIIGYQDAGMLQQIRKSGQLLEEEYLPEGIRVKAYLPQDIYNKISSRQINV